MSQDRHTGAASSRPSQGPACLGRSGCFGMSPHGTTGQADALSSGGTGA